MKAVFIGSISTLADTSDMQRKAFNRAFAEAGLDWHWSGEDYRARLMLSGGRDRIADYAREQGASVDADALHSRKTEIFVQDLRAGTAQMRDQTQGMLEYARTHGLIAAFVSGTSKGSIDALVEGFGGAQLLGFDLITSGADAAPKPDAGLYRFALDALGLAAKDVLAVEDNRAGIEAAKAAGIEVLAYPNSNTAGHDFTDVQGMEVWSARLSSASQAAA